MSLSLFASRSSRVPSDRRIVQSVLCRLGLAFALVGLLGSTGCMSTPGSVLRSQSVMGTATEVAGPGHVFSTAEEAAFDALAWCQAEATRTVAGRTFARGGTVYPVDGGFSYAAPVLADGASARLQYRLRPIDVLHFRHYPSSAASATGPSRNALPIRDRRVVDRGDPLQRPIYYMTPDRRVRLYSPHDREQNLRTLAWRMPNDAER
jgi:hypothetical protein